MLGFALAISLVSGIFFGLAPALTSGHQSVGTSAIRIATGRSALRSALVVVEVALTLVLLVGAGLLVRSFANLILVDKGFNAAHVVRFGLATPTAKYPTPEARTQFFQTALAGLAALPTVRAVGLVNELPLAGGGVNGGVEIEGRTFAPGQLPMPEDIRKFLADTSPNKRARVIDELLQHPLHAAVWATKLCDITGADNRVLYDRAVSNMHDWYRNKLTANWSWDKIAMGVVVATTA